MGMSALAIFAVYVNATNEKKTRPVSRRVGELTALRISSLDAEKGQTHTYGHHLPASTPFTAFSWLSLSSLRELCGLSECNERAGKGLHLAKDARKGVEMVERMRMPCSR